MTQGQEKEVGLPEGVGDAGWRETNKGGKIRMAVIA